MLLVPLSGFDEAAMIQRIAFVAAVCAELLALAGPLSADEYRPGELLGMDLSEALLSPKRLGPNAEFAPIKIEARADPALEVLARAKPAVGAGITIGRAGITHAIPGRKRVALAKPGRRLSNPIDANASDMRIQTWPCKSGGICNWQR